jgi:hypothetical protein
LDIRDNPRVWLRRLDNHAFKLLGSSERGWESVVKYAESDNDGCAKSSRLQHQNSFLYPLSGAMKAGRSKLGYCLPIVKP